MAFGDVVREKLVREVTTIFGELEREYDIDFGQARIAVTAAIEEGLGPQTRSEVRSSDPLSQLENSIDHHAIDGDMYQWSDTKDPKELFEAYNRLRKKHEKVLRECTHLKSVNQDLLTRLSRAQSKLRDWNQFDILQRSSSPSRPSSRNGPQSVQGGKSRYSGEQQSTPDLPRSRSNVHQGSDISASRLDAARWGNLNDHARTFKHSRGPMILDLLGPENYDSSISGSSKNRSPSLKRSYSKMENLNYLQRSPSPRLGDISTPVVIKSESSSSSFEKVDKLEDIPSSNPEDLSRSRRPPTPKRAKVRASSERRTNQSSTRAPIKEEVQPQTTDISTHSLMSPRPKTSPSSLASISREVREVWRANPGTSDDHRTIREISHEEHAQGKRAPLRHLDQNIRVLPRTSEIVNPPSRKGKSSADAVQQLTEDGESLFPRSNQSTEAMRVHSDPAEGDRRNVYSTLNKLLHTPSPARLELPQQPRTSPRRVPFLDKVPLNQTRRSTPSHANTSERRKSVPRQPITTSTTPRHRAPPLPPSNPSKPSSPLRSRPPHLLHLSDFKINPARNSGLTYAYTDVVRNRALRKCLPGCTRPECCGNKFRALATTLPLPQQHQEAESSDDELLASFLGTTADNIAHITQAERTDYLLQAKTRLAADNYGKMHRHQWQPERRRSPPGFWRTDFPATQEAEEDRREADRIVEEMVRGRWREAMKRGGLWLFRDE